MEPISLAALTLLGCGAACVGGVAGYLIRHLKPSKKEIEVAELKRSLKIALINQKNLEQNNEHSLRANKELKRQRDDYKKIASSHEITIRHPKEKFGKDPIKRRYDSTIDKNLERFLQDLEEMSDGKLVVAEVEVYVVGTWKQHLRRNTWSWNSTELNKFNIPAKHMRTFTLKGRAEEIADELKTILRDPAWNLSTLAGKWEFPSAPISIQTKIWVATSVAEPKVKTVEVLRVEKEFEVVEIVKEVPILVDEPREKTPADIRDIIASQVEVELALREAKKVGAVAARKQRQTQ
jgi:hypothetical protein